MTQIATTGFDYESVDKETAGKLAYYADRGHKLMKASQVRFIAEMGEMLSEAQKELASHHSGTFVKWATSEFDISQKTVYNYVNAWLRLLCNGYTTYQNLSPTAIYLLTAEDTPKPVVKKIEHLAAQNEPVRKADVQRLIDAAKPKPPSKPTEQPGPQRATPASVAQINAQSKQVAAELGDKPEPSASIVLDALDREVPPKFREAHQLGITLLGIGRDVDKFRQQAKELSEQSGGEWLPLQDIDEHVRALKGHFQQARYHTLCHRCKGKSGDCKTCHGVGFLPEYLKATI